MRATTLSLVALLTAGIAPAASAAPAGWRPEPATFGVSAPVFTSVRMDDGVMISTEVVYPTDPATGARAAGHFPVLLTQNPYGADRSDPTSGGKYFVQRGYIYVASAIRGTGTSGGQVDWFGERQGRDGAELVGWAARTLPGSDGKVGLDGCSYLGVDQWFTAAAVGRHSALKAIAPFCTDSDFYNDLTADGGIPTSFVAGIAHAEPRGPQDDPATDPQSVTIAQQATGGPRAYDNDYWQQLDVQRLMPTIVANGVPALSEAGWQDLFPGGNLGAYVAAQNAYFHRPLTAPVTAGDPTTGRYQAIVGPWTHGEHVNEASLQSIRLEWFDTWLKGTRTGMANTRTPLHLFENTASRWVDTAAWPPSPTASSFHFDGGGTLTWAPGSSLTYTTAPLTRSMVLDGPSDLTVYANSTTPEVELSATLNVLGADGHVVKQADGILLGSQRQLDTTQSWYAAGRTLIQPSHPFTQASQRAVPVGQATRYDLSLLANFTEITAGQRIQVVLTTQPPANFHLAMAPTPQQRAGLAGGVYTIQHATLNLPLAAPDRFRTSSADWGPIS
jgi:predicted acyl esterase